MRQRVLVAIARFGPGFDTVTHGYRLPPERFEASGRRRNAGRAQARGRGRNPVAARIACAGCYSCSAGNPASRSLPEDAFDVVRALGLHDDVQFGFARREVGEQALVFDVDDVGARRHRSSG